MCRSDCSLWVSYFSGQIANYLLSVNGHANPNAIYSFSIEASPAMFVRKLCKRPCWNRSVCVAANLRPPYP